MPPAWSGSGARATARGYDRLVVYADREHSANLIVPDRLRPALRGGAARRRPAGDPAVLVGNECFGMAGAAPLPMRRHLFQDLSLPGQPRDRSRPLAESSPTRGSGTGSRVGVVGWKTYADPDDDRVPAFLVDELRGVAAAGSVENATDLLIDPATGCGSINEVEQLARSSTPPARRRAACRHCSSGSARDDRAGGRALLGWNGMPLSCHLMLTAGPRASLGLLSPAIAHRARRPLHRRLRHLGRAQLPRRFRGRGRRRAADGVGDYVERLVAPYFEAIAEWYGALHVGQTGGALQEIIDRHLGDPFFGIFLNPGHQIHLDEWVNSPVGPGSTIELRSGMALQVDVIPATGTDYFTTNIEDGIALADETLRAAFAERDPEPWGRIQARRRSCATRWASSCTRTCCPSRISRPAPPFLLEPGSGDDDELRRLSAADDGDGLDLDQLPSVAEDRHARPTCSAPRRSASAAPPPTRTDWRSWSAPRDVDGGLHRHRRAPPRPRTAPAGSGWPRPGRSVPPGRRLRPARRSRPGAPRPAVKTSVAPRATATCE